MVSLTEEMSVLLMVHRHAMTLSKTTRTLWPVQTVWARLHRRVADD